MDPEEEPVEVARRQATLVIEVPPDMLVGADAEELADAAVYRLTKYLDAYEDQFGVLVYLKVPGDTDRHVHFAVAGWTCPDCSYVGGPDLPAFDPRG